MPGHKGNRPAPGQCPLQTMPWAGGWTHTYLLGRNLSALEVSEAPPHQVSLSPPGVSWRLGPGTKKVWGTVRASPRALNPVPGASMQRGSGSHLDSGTKSLWIGDTVEVWVQRELPRVPRKKTMVRAGSRTQSSPTSLDQQGPGSGSLSHFSENLSPLRLRGDREEPEGLVVRPVLPTD